MDRIDTPTATSERKFTDGEPGEAAATDLNAKWFNNVQEEISGAIESSGIDLDPADQGQLFKAINKIVFNSFKSQVIQNNVTGVALNGVSFSSHSIKGIKVDYIAERKSDTSSKICWGEVVFLRHANTWKKVNEEESGMDCGVTLNIAESSGNASVNYTSNDHQGANYSGSINFRISYF